MCNDLVGKHVNDIYIYIGDIIRLKFVGHGA